MREPVGTACAGAVTAFVPGTTTVADVPAGTVTRSVTTPPDTDQSLTAWPYGVASDEDAEVNPPPIDPPGPPGDGVTPEAALARLTAATATIADEIDGAKGEQWTRAGTTPGGERMTAVDVARHAVHEGIHHLRAADKVLREVVGHPTSPGP